MCKGAEGSKGRSPPTPTREPGITPSALPTPPPRGGRGKDCGNPPPLRAPTPWEVLGCHLSDPNAAPPPASPGPERRGHWGSSGAESGSPGRRGLTDRVETRASPRSAAGVGEGGGDGRPGLRGPRGSRQVQRLALPAPTAWGQRSVISCGTRA